MIGDVEDRLRTDLPRLADLRIEDPPRADTSAPRSGGVNPRRLAIVAVVVLVVGLGALALLAQSDDDEVVETADVEEAPETAPPLSDAMAALLADLGDAEVMIDVYSGRTNPMFEIDSARVAEVLALVEGLDVIDAADLDAGRLGFRGFLLAAPGDPLGPTVDVRADQVVVHLADGATVVRSDPDGLTLAAVAELARPEIEALGFDPDALVDSGVIVAGLGGQRYVRPMSDWTGIARSDGLPRRLPDTCEAFETILARASAVDVDARRAASPIVDRWVDQFVVDVSAIDAATRRELAGALGDDQFPFVVAVWTLDMDDRLRHAWRQLTGDDPEARAPRRAPDDGDLWAALDAFLPIVSRADHLDALTTEVVRLRGARANNCRLCRSLRNVDAMAAGADDQTFDAIDDYEASDLAPSLKAALRLVDAMLWTPKAWPTGVVDGVRDHFTPDQAAELVFDVVRNGANRIAVALGADEANVESGVEYFAVDADGQLTYGLAAPRP